MVEFANRLVARGHEVTFYLPDDAEPALHVDALRRGGQADARPGFGDELDVVLFNHEPQWHLLDRFERARRRVFYALHYGHLYGKEGSWESVRAPVDLQLANSNWTADQIYAETGHRPTVQLGGVNRDVFRPYPGPKRYPLLCSGEQQRAWKGTDTILEAGARSSACRSSGTRARTSTRPRSAASTRRRGCSRSAAGSRASASPGSRRSRAGRRSSRPTTAAAASTRSTARPRWSCRRATCRAMADAIRRLLDDDALAARLVANGLDVVERDFDWERRTDEFEAVLDGVVRRTRAPRRRRTRPAAPAEPELSVVVLAWDNLAVHAAVRRVGAPQHRRALRARDRRQRLGVGGGQLRARRGRPGRCCNDTNLGFARGMNQGLDGRARPLRRVLQQRHGRCPPGWAAHAAARPRARIRTPAIVVPAVTDGAQPGERAHRAGRRRSRCCRRSARRPPRSST